MKKIVFVLLMATCVVSVSLGSDKEQCIKSCQKNSNIAQCITEKCDISASSYSHYRIGYGEMLWGIKGLGFYEFSDFLENSENLKH